MPDKPMRHRWRIINALTGLVVKRSIDRANQLSCQTGARHFVQVG